MMLLFGQAVPPDFWAEALKQSPILTVLAVIVIYFVKTLTGERDKANKAREVERLAQQAEREESRRQVQSAYDRVVIISDSHREFQKETMAKLEAGQREMFMRIEHIAERYHQDATATQKALELLTIAATRGVTNVTT